MAVALAASTIVNLSTFSVGSGYGYDPTGASALHGSILYTGAPNAATVNADGSININCVIPGNQGPFTFGEVAVYTSLGVLFAIATLPALETKYSSLSTGVASVFSFNLVLDVGLTASTVIGVTSLTTTTTTPAVIQLVNQAAHGFTVGQVIAHNGSAYVLALSTTSAVTTNAVGLVSYVVDANNFILTTDGRITGLSGLTTGGVYYVSTTSAGALSTTNPGYTNQVLIAETSTTGYVKVGPTSDVYTRTATTDNATYNLLLTENSTPNLPAQYAANLFYNPSTGVLTAPSFSGMTQSATYASSSGLSITKTVTLAAGTWKITLLSTGIATDNYGNFNYNITQALLVNGVTQISNSETMARAGGSGYGRNVGGQVSGSYSLVVSSSASYTITTSDTTAVGSNITGFIPTGSFVILEKTA